tara:strand:- start:3221 stop:3412 length:192 start_codon:yes stop_codon:yes gene_type:complete
MKAIFEFKNKNYILPLTKLYSYILKKDGLKTLIPRLKKEVWTNLKLRGENVTISEIKFKGINN